jgi:hypothetical protein
VHGEDLGLTVDVASLEALTPSIKALKDARNAAVHKVAMKAAKVQREIIERDRQAMRAPRTSRARFRPADNRLRWRACTRGILEFFTANIHYPNTRAASARAVSDFCTRLWRHNVPFEHVEAIAVV